MTREQLEHEIRAAAAIAGVEDIDCSIPKEAT
jgi:hypothetical protein